MSNPWFRFYKEFMNDPVIQSMAFEDQRHYTVLLCMKCDGVLDRKITPIARERIILRGLGLDSVTGDEVKRRLQEVGLISKNWQPKSWNKRQFISDHSTERSRKSRKTKEPCNGQEALLQRDCNAPDTDTDTDTDTDKTSSNQRLPCPHKEIVNLYHEICPTMPRVVEWNKPRQGYLNARWRENPDRQGLGWWRGFFEFAAESNFLSGKTEGRDGKPPFVATLEWMVKPQNFAKIIEGNYHRG